MKAVRLLEYGGELVLDDVPTPTIVRDELQMAPVRSSVHIPVATLWAHFQGGDVEKGLAELEKQANVMIDDLLWWTAAPKTARER